MEEAAISHHGRPEGKQSTPVLEGAQEVQRDVHRSGLRAHVPGFRGGSGRDAGNGHLHVEFMDCFCPGYFRRCAAVLSAAFCLRMTGVACRTEACPGRGRRNTKCRNVMFLPVTLLLTLMPWQLLEMEYDDGGAPPPEIIHKWLDVVRTTFQHAPDSSGPNGSDGPTIAVHCVAGLGRAPVLVAIALIEYGKVSLVCVLGKTGRKPEATRLEHNPVACLMTFTTIGWWPGECGLDHSASCEECISVEEYDVGTIRLVRKGGGAVMTSNHDHCSSVCPPGSY